MSTWTDERVELLKQLWSEGLTAGDIRKLMGVTRAAVVGKLYRLGLLNKLSDDPDEREAQREAQREATGLAIWARRKALAQREEGRRAIQKAKVAKSRVVKAVDASTVRKAQPARPGPVEVAAVSTGRPQPPTPVPETLAAPGSSPRPWITRRYGECCWPVGTPPYPAAQLSCCAPTDGAHHYCAHHRDRAKGRALATRSPGGDPAKHLERQLRRHVG